MKLICAHEGCTAKLMVTNRSGLCKHHSTWKDRGNHQPIPRPGKTIVTVKDVGGYSAIETSVKVSLPAAPWEAGEVNRIRNEALGRDE